MKSILKTIAIVGTVFTGLYLYNNNPTIAQAPTTTSLGTCDSEWTKEQLRTIVTRDFLGNNTIIYDVTEIGGGEADDGTLHCFGHAFTSAGQKLILFQVMWTDSEHKRWYIEAILLPM